ncbi:hypothetical protein EBO15_15415 [Actinomadura harenae]|uniref:Uncharacterized protein n=1 Tax=Actinomadura harenae TaxID=2483351 RepID=A0A3M2M1T3_9ACTN|nr:hypothetical protein EBO15_15415 [Actinomadura harenae]
MPRPSCQATGSCARSPSKTGCGSASAARPASARTGSDGRTAGPEGGGTEPEGGGTESEGGGKGTEGGGTGAEGGGTGAGRRAAGSLSTRLPGQGGQWACVITGGKLTPPPVDVHCQESLKTNPEPSPVKAGRPLDARP